MFEKLMIFVRKTLPDYEHSFRDFHFVDDLGEVSLFWNPKFSVPKPTEKDLEEITEEQIKESNKKVCCRCKIPVVESESDIIHYSEGSIALINGTLKIFHSKRWKEI